MRKVRSQGNRKAQFKKEYRGPFPINSEVPIHNVRKSMRPSAEGPTAETFSDQDGTTNMLSKSENDFRLPSENKRPTKERRFEISGENIFLFILGIVAAGIGIIVYNHSNKFVAIEKDVEYISNIQVENATF